MRVTRTSSPISSVNWSYSRPAAATGDNLSHHGMDCSSCRASWSSIASCPNSAMNWAPTGSDVAAYQRADLILLNGAGYAGWTELVSLPEQKTVNTSAGFSERFIVKAEEAHSHGSDDEHTHEAE